MAIAHVTFTCYYDYEVEIDDMNRIRMDSWELRDSVQSKCKELWPKVTTENLFEMSDYADYKKSLKEYLEPTDLIATTKYYKDRFDKAEEALNQVAEDLKKEIADTKFKDIDQGKTYLQKEKEKYIEAKNKKAKVDIDKAKTDLRKVYDGDSDIFKLDPALMKVLNSKIWEIDNDYDGDLVDYIEPNLFGKFLKEDTAYNMVKDILDEMEQELSEDKVNKRYTEYINEIKKSL